MYYIYLKKKMSFGSINIMKFGFWFIFEFIIVPIYNIGYIITRFKNLSFKGCQLYNMISTYIFIKYCTYFFYFYLM